MLHLCSKVKPSSISSNIYDIILFENLQMEDRSHIVVLLCIIMRFSRYVAPLEQLIFAERSDNVISPTHI